MAKDSGIMGRRNIPTTDIKHGKDTKNITQQMTTAIWKCLDLLELTFLTIPETAKDQANEDGNCK